MKGRKMKPFYFIRHGDITRYTNHQGIAPNNHLTDTGRFQAQRIKPKIDSFSIDYMVTSPLDRCIETAEIIAPYLFPSRMEIDGLQECTISEWLQLDELYESPEKLGSFPLARDYISRVTAAINEGLSKEGTPLFVAHGGTYSVINYLLKLKLSKRIEYCKPIFFNPEEKELKYN